FEDRRLINNFPQALAVATGLDPVPQIALGREIRQPDQLHFSCDAEERPVNDASVLLSLLIVVDNNEHELVSESFGECRVPFALAVRHTGSAKAKRLMATIRRFLTINNEDFVSLRERVPAIE